MDDILSLLTGDEPTAQQKAAALTAALRRQQDAGNLALLTGDSVLGKYGQAQLQQATEGQHQLADMGKVRLQRTLEAQRMAQEKAMQEAKLSEESQYHQGELGVRRQALELGKWSHLTNPLTGQVFKQDTRTGDVTPVTDALVDDKGQPLGRRGGANQQEKEWKDLAEAVSTYRGRGNLNRENQASLQRAEALERLVLGPNGDILNLTPQQLREASTSLAGLISRGGSQAISQIEELTPHTMAGQFANLKQKLLNEPAGAEGQAFLRNMLDTAAREKKLIVEQIRRGQLQGIPNHAHLRGVDKSRFDSILQGAGVDPASVDDRGLPATQAQSKELPSSLETPSDTVRVVSPEGKVGNIPRANLEKALARGFKEAR